MSQESDFGKLNFEEVVKWMLPAFPMVKNEHSIGPISIACVSVIANNLKRQGDVKWNEPLEDKLDKWNLITGDETYDDLRLNLIIVGDAGSGKTALMKGIANLNPFKVNFRQSQPNYDQLIGSTEKWMEGKKWKYEPMAGELSADIVLMDEVLSVYLVDTPENKKIRELLRSSLSRIGTNRITKPMVRIPEQFQVNYYPECSLIQGFPPRRVPVSLISEGDLRRAQLIVVNFPLQEKEKTRRFGTDAPKKRKVGSDKAYRKAKDYLSYLRGKKFEFWVPTSTMDYIKKSMDNLKEYTTNYGMKASWFYKIAYFDIESQLLRYAIVMSVVRDSTKPVVTVDIEDVKKAWKYFSTAYADALLWLNNYTTGDYSVGKLKERDFDKTSVLIEWLRDKGAFSSTESNVSVNDFKDLMLEKRWYSSPAGAKRFYQSLLDGGYIRSSRRGRKWIIWIGPAGKELLSESGVETPWG